MKLTKHITARAMALTLGITAAAAVPAGNAFCGMKVMYMDGRSETLTFYSRYDQLAENVGAAYGEAAKQAWITAQATGDFGPYYQAIGSVLPSYLDPKITSSTALNPSEVESACYLATGKKGTIPYSQVMAKASEVGQIGFIYALGIENGTYPAMAPTVTNTSIKNGGTTTAAPATNTSSSSKDFDAAAYAARYPDLAKAGITTPEQLYQHWVTYGQKEGRIGTK